MNTPMIEKIEAILDSDVRPALADHHGNVIVVDYSDDILRVRMTGMCNGCFSAQLTTESLIAAKIREKLPQIKDVILLTGVSDALIAQAKSMMHPYRPQK